MSVLRRQAAAAAALSLLLAAGLTACRSEAPKVEPAAADEAAANRTTLIATKDTSARGALDRAAEALDRRDPDLAELALQPVLRAGTGDLEIESLRAQIAWYRGEWDRSRELAGPVRTALEPHVRQWPTDLRVRTVLSRARLVLGDLRGAEVQLRAAIRRGLTEPKVIARWVDLLVQRSNIETQWGLLEKTLETHPNRRSPLLAATEGLALLEMSRAEDAAKTVDRALGALAGAEPAAPKHHRARLLLVRALIELEAGRFEAAKSHADAARTLDPADSDSEHMLGIIAWRTRRHDEAESHFARALELRADPEHAYLLGVVRAEARERESAIDALQVAVDRIELWSRSAEDRWQVPFLLGRLLARNRSYARAQQVLELALRFQVRPDSQKRILRHLTWVRQKGEKPRAGR